MARRSLVVLIVAVGVVACAVAAALRSRPASPEVPPVPVSTAAPAGATYVDSDRCLPCHADAHASWARTYHSRMTQEARPESVQGDFERRNRFEYLGVRARMERRGDAFTMTFAFPDGREEVHPIARTVGSRRMEQYLTRRDDRYLRLPLAYDLVNRRWTSLNGSFFHPDGKDFFQHQALWDANCVFCHNVRAQPNMDPASRRFRTEVEELGIACGACHGPASAHVEAAASPEVRARWKADPAADRLLVQPRKLPSERSLMVCGHCHGQRVPEPMDRIQQIMTQGDPYTPGEDLNDYYRPVWRETRVGEYSFANRFWDDGSPRLTAYEYQGILRSKCYTAGEPGKRIQCLSCHTMHEGDPKGQITPENRTDRPCLSCHEEYAERKTLAAHTGHRVEGAGSRCYNCHMPRVVYGVMSVHRTHEISVPDPRLTAERAVPNACNTCHLDRSVNWAVRAAAKLWPRRFAGAAPAPDAQFDLPEGPRALYAGDALARALAAEALAGGGPVPPDPGWAAPYLYQAFRDRYPIVRYFAARGLPGAGGTGPDYLAPAEEREKALARLGGKMDRRGLEEAAAMARTLRSRRVEKDVEVGE